MYNITENSEEKLQDIKTNSTMQDGVNIKYIKNTIKYGKLKRSHY